MYQVCRNALECERHTQMLHDFLIAPACRNVHGDTVTSEFYSVSSATVNILLMKRLSNICLIL